MGQKRKASRLGTAGGRSSGLDEDGRERKTRLNIRTYEDVADSEDEFHLNRDRIILDDSQARKRQRRQDEHEESYSLSDEEILAVPEEDSDREAEELGSEEFTSSGADFEDAELADGDELGADGLEATPSRTKRTIEEDFDVRGWGRSKKDYYDADVIETEGDAQEEEAEALRLQRKHLESMQDADFGLDDFDSLNGAAHAPDIDDEDGIVQESLPEVEVLPSLPSEQKTRVLHTRYPELHHLAKELLGLQSRLEQVQLDSVAAEASRGRATDDSIPFATAKWIALRAYLAALTFYFTLLTSGDNGLAPSGKSRSAVELHKHPVMECLLRCRDTWRELESLDMFPLTLQHKDSTTNVAISRVSGDDEAPQSTVRGQAPANAELKKRRRKSKKSKAQREAEAALAEADLRRRERGSRMRAHMDSLNALGDLRAQPEVVPAVARPAEDGDGSDFGEETALGEHEAAAKAKRKKSLRFYTAQIAQKANKRDLARRDMGGDTDIPYRERFRDRQSRLNQEAERRGKTDDGPGLAALGNGASDEEDAAVATQARQAADNDYYEQVAAATRRKAADKAALKEARREAAAMPGAVVRATESVGPDGKRAVSYAIEKNKGLAPSGRKSARAPRVKKRKTFEDKLKKLSSLRPQYKGGEGRGGYGGELTGIKSNLIKSIKL